MKFLNRKGLSGTWETHPCRKPKLTSTSEDNIGIVWRCACGRRWMLEDRFINEAGNWVMTWVEQDQTLTEEEFLFLENFANEPGASA